MKIELLKSFDQVPYFTIAGFKQILGLNRKGDQYAVELIHHWIEAGHVVALKRGVYVTRRFFEGHVNEPNFAAVISAILVPQSYLSLEYVLQQEGVLTEATYPITAVTTKNTRTIRNTIGTYDYRHIKAALYKGFYREVYFGVNIHRASIAKALFDYFYLRPLPRSLRTHDLSLAEDLRLNLDDLATEYRNEFEYYVQVSATKKMSFILENLQKTIWQP